MGCEFCEQDGGAVLWRDAFCRIVRAAYEDYPGFCRVILNRHVREMTDLPESERDRMMHAVFACEQVLRELYRPEKVNLASLGNQVPHLHWHVLALFADDAHFPDTVWSAARRSGARRAAVSDAALGARLRGVLG
jgi:diadenosine tetraphosphate (Ap4A) HIT family hydrolase